MIIFQKAKTLENDNKEQLIEYLGTIGRIINLSPIYPAIYKRNKEVMLILGLIIYLFIFIMKNKIFKKKYIFIFLYLTSY